MHASSGRGREVTAAQRRTHACRRSHSSAHPSNPAGPRWAPPPASPALHPLFVQEPGVLRAREPPGPGRMRCLRHLLPGVPAVPAVHRWGLTRVGHTTGAGGELPADRCTGDLTRPGRRTSDHRARQQAAWLTVGQHRSQFRAVALSSDRQPARPTAAGERPRRGQLRPLHWPDECPREIAHLQEWWVARGPPGHA